MGGEYPGVLCRELETTPTFQNEGFLMFRLSSWWYSLQDTLWFIPGLMTAGAMLLSIVVLQIDRTVLPAQRLHTWWLFEGGAEGARGVLSAIAGTMMTVATTAFSITIVAVQLGSSQFSPRILRGFTGDRGNQVVLGAFISTFAYSLLVLRSVRSATSDGQIFVPSASVSLAIVLALLSIASLIYFFHHATRTIQASVVIDRVAQDTFRLVERELDIAAERSNYAGLTLASTPDVEVSSATSGYVTGLDEHALCRLAERHDGTVFVHINTGDFLFTGTKIASMTVARDEGPDPLHVIDDVDAVIREVRRALTIDMERTLEQDVRFGFRQLADIAVKALSPGINDPTTATMCIDRLGEALVHARELPGGLRTRTDGSGHPRLVQKRPGFESLLHIAVQQIRLFGAGDATVIAHLLRTLNAIVEDATLEARSIVIVEAKVVLDAALLTTDLPADRMRLQDAGAWAL